MGSTRTSTSEAVHGGNATGMEFSFVSLEPRPWSPASSVAGSPRVLHSSEGPRKRASQQPSVASGGSNLHSRGSTPLPGSAGIDGSQIAIMSFQATQHLNSQASLALTLHTEHSRDSLDAAIACPIEPRTSVSVSIPLPGVKMDAGRGRNQMSALSMSPKQPARSTTHHGRSRSNSPTRTEAAPADLDTEVVQGVQMSLSAPQHSDAARFALESRQVPHHPYTLHYPPGYGQDKVDDLLNRYQVTTHLPLTLHLRTQKHNSQLQQYRQLRSQLQAAQAVMLAGTGAAQFDAPPQGVAGAASIAGPELTRSSLEQATRGTGVPSMHRFHANNIMRDGMYLASGEYSFAGSPPLRSNPSASLLFERYSSKEPEVPQVQRYYFRPAGVKPKAPPPRSHPVVPRACTASARRLPNGIPVCRLASEQASRRVVAAETGVAARGTPLMDHLLMGPMHAVQTAMRSGQAGGSPPRAGEHVPPTLNHAINQAMGALPSARGAPLGDDPTKLLTSPRDTDPGFPSTVDPSIALLALGSAGTLGATTAEPLLDDPFAELVKTHFKELAENQTHKLQQRLNASLPSILQTMGVSSATLKTH